LRLPTSLAVPLLPHTPLSRSGLFARRADNLLVAGVANQYHAVACVREAAHLSVHFPYQRTRGVDRRQVTGGSSAVDLGSDTVRGDRKSTRLNSSHQIISCAVL